jgi:KAP-like P-loop domain-containing protein
LSDEVVDAFEARMSTIETFKIELADLIKAVVAETQKKPPVFVLIDELDRCRPSYAVSLLERVKHLFSVEGVVFVIATDTEQLGYAVSGAYGNSFNGARYLKRFFDRTYRFQPVAINQFVVDQFHSLGLSEDDFEAPPSRQVIEFMVEAFSQGDIQLRDVKQMMEKLQTFTSVWPNRGIKIQLAYLLPLIHEEHTTGESNLVENSPIRNLKGSIYSYVANDRSRQSIDVSANEFISEINKEGHDIFGYDEREQYSGVSDWVRTVFRQEGSVLHNNSYLRADPPASVLLNYPSLLAQIAAFDSSEN